MSEDWAGELIAHFMPALKYIGTNLAGGLFSDIDDIGDAEQYVTP